MDHVRGAHDVHWVVKSWQTFCSSVTSICRWCITTGYISAGSRISLLPVSMQLCDLGPLSARLTEVSANVAVPPWEDGPAIGSVGSDVVVFPELGVAPLVDSGTDLEARWFPGYGCCSAGRGHSSGSLSCAKGRNWSGAGEGPSWGLCYTDDGDAHCGPCGGIGRVTDFAPGASPSHLAWWPAGPCVGSRGLTGSCVSVFSPSGGGWKSGSGMLSIVPGVACWLWVWADHLPDLAVVTDGQCSQAATPHGHDGPVLAAG